MGTRSSDGYAAIGDYALIGDGRTAALVARDGAIDWLCLPNLDSESVFAALLDARRGGCFRLAPTVPFESERRYLPDTNVLETTFRTAEGAVRVVDALTVPAVGLAPLRELVRRVEGLAGQVPMAWTVAPRFHYGAVPARIERRYDRLVASEGATALALSAWEAGAPAVVDGSVRGDFALGPGERALLALSATYQEPLVLPARREAEDRLDATERFWRDWAQGMGYDGPWREAVRRSGLVLKLLVFAPSGAVAAAPTTSLPEEIGGERNWDYRYCWIRDSAFTLDALLRLGCPREARSFLSWLLHASAHTHPYLNPLYQLNGGAHAPERTLAHLEGYRGSRPARFGNGALDQTQLDLYGNLLDTLWIYVREGGRLDRDTGGELSEVADLVCRIWDRTDAGVWEVRSEPRHFTHSKVMCWVALDRAIRLARKGELRSDRLERWERNAAAIREFVETRCWSEDRQTYVRFADGDELDASLLVLPIMEYCDPRGERMQRTIDAVRRELGYEHGPFIHRYRAEDGLAGEEGAFLTCSFWYANALARAGRLEEAARTMDELAGVANDVGLYAEEVDPRSGELLGNFPQGLSHLALVNAAVAFSRAQEER